MRDKNSGRSRGFAFITFVEYSEHGVKELTNQMLNPSKPHLIQNRAVEIRQSDGGKPQDSFIVKKKQGQDKKEKEKSRKEYSRKQDQPSKK